MSARSCGHPDNRFVESHISGTSEAARIAKREDAAIRRHQPVPMSARSYSHRHDGPIQPEATGAAITYGSAKREDASVRCDQVVAGHHDWRHGRWCPATNLQVWSLRSELSWII